MIELIAEYPVIEDNGKERFDIIKHYAKDENGGHYYVKQLITGNVYEEAVDVYPCKYAYVATEEAVELEEEILEEFEQ